MGKKFNASKMNSKINHNYNSKEQKTQEFVSSHPSNRDFNQMKIKTKSMMDCPSEYIQICPYFADQMNIFEAMF